MCFCSRFLPDSSWQFFSLLTLLPLGLWVSVKTILLMTDKVLAWGYASVDFLRAVKSITDTTLKFQGSFGKWRYINAWYNSLAMFCLLHEQCYLLVIIPVRGQIKLCQYLPTANKIQTHIFTSSPVKIHTYAHSLVLLLKIAGMELRNKPIASSLATVILPTLQWLWRLHASVTAGMARCGRDTASYGSLKRHGK